jgi:hypothetical protein
VIGAGYHQGASNWYIYACGFTSGSAVSFMLGSNFIVNCTVPYELTLYAAPQATSVAYMFEDLANGYIANGSITRANLPPPTQLLSLASQRQVSSLGNGITLGFVNYSIAVEHDY